MHSSRLQTLLDGLDRLLALHNEVFNDPSTKEEAEFIRNFTISWPVEYRAMRNSLYQVKVLDEEGTLDES